MLRQASGRSRSDKGFPVFQQSSLALLPGLLSADYKSVISPQRAQRGVPQSHLGRIRPFEPVPGIPFPLVWSDQKAASEKRGRGGQKIAWELDRFPDPRKRWEPERAGKPGRLLLPRKIL